jgi:hypothetical protein
MTHDHFDSLSSDESFRIRPSRGSTFDRLRLRIEHPKADHPVVDAEVDRANLEPGGTSMTAGAFSCGFNATTETIDFVFPFEGTRQLVRVPTAEMEELLAEATG